MKNKLTILLAFICTACFPVDVIGQHEAVDIAKKSEIEAMGNQYMLLGVAGSYFNARLYSDAERIYNIAIKGLPITDPMIYSNMSVFIGKQGRYNEAISWADKALKMRPNDFHGKIVKASWLIESGDKEGGDKLFDECVSDAKFKELHKSFYWDCLSCYLASSDRKDELKDAISKAVENGDLYSMKFIKMDIVFDKYRNENWFIQLVGKTIASQGEGNGQWHGFIH